MTTDIIISLIILAVVVSILITVCVALWVSTTAAVKEVNRLCEEVWQQEAKINELATVVAKNAARTTRLEGEDAPRRPACPATYIADTYPKRWDEV